MFVVRSLRGNYNLVTMDSLIECDHARKRSVVGNSNDGNAALRMESKRELTMKNSLTLIITAAVVLAIFMAPTPAGAQGRGVPGARGAGPANLNAPTPRLPNGKPDFSAQSWARPFTGDITLTFTNPDGTSNKGESHPLPFTQWGQAQWDNYNPPKNGDYAGSCMPFGWIRSFSPHPMSIQQNNNYITFLFEQSTMFQMVPTDGRPHREGWPPHGSAIRLATGREIRWSSKL